MKTGALLMKKPAATAAEVAAVVLDKDDKALLAQMEAEAEANGEEFDSEEEREKLKALKAEQAKQRLKKMKTGALLTKKPAAEVAAVVLDKDDRALLAQMEAEAEAQGEEFDSEEEREKLKALKAEQARQR